jgi:hypothetical protein
MKGTSFVYTTVLGHSNETKEGGHNQYNFSLLADLNSTPIIDS